LRSSTNLTAERSPNSGMLIIGTGANGKHHSSLTLNFSLRPTLV
jgi:hypothetical protein